MGRYRLCWVILALLTVTSCAKESALVPTHQTAVSSTKPAAVPTTQARSDMRTKPFMFDEASLPKGYPGPGPVGEIMVKRYPAARVAINRGGDQDSMFMPLFNHIKKHDIAMSSPVEITWADPQTQPSAPQPGETQPSSMAFVYREPGIGTTGPDGKVEVMDVPPQLFVSIGIRGSYNQKHLIEGVTQLRAWLAGHASEYKQAGPPRYLGYNSPFVPPFLRFGEVQLPISELGGR